MDIHSAATAFPERIDDNVYFCGYASPNSYGAASYLIVRPEGNVLVDSPRFAKVLVQRIEELGGVKTMFFTHQDDVADHEQFHKHFGCRRIIHRAECRESTPSSYSMAKTRSNWTRTFSRVPVPGHTRSRFSTAAGICSRGSSGVVRKSWWAHRPAMSRGTLGGTNPIHAAVAGLPI
jgi:glyoxylase-like metal-dependent hydrolase (beta-lactamase superfamily II)